MTAGDHLAHLTALSIKYFSGQEDGILVLRCDCSSSLPVTFLGRRVASNRGSWERVHPGSSLLHAGGQNRQDREDVTLCPPPPSPLPRRHKPSSTPVKRAKAGPNAAPTVSQTRASPPRRNRS